MPSGSTACCTAAALGRRATRVPRAVPRPRSSAAPRPGQLGAGNGGARRGRRRCGARSSAPPIARSSTRSSGEGTGARSPAATASPRTSTTRTAAPDRAPRRPSRPGPMWPRRPRGPPPTGPPAAGPVGGTTGVRRRSRPDANAVPMTRSHARSSLAWLPGFVLLSAVWGSSFALIKIALEAGVAPPWVAFGRCALGALTLLVICVLWRTRCPASGSPGATRRSSPCWPTPCRSCCWPTASSTSTRCWPGCSTRPPP